MHSCHFSTIRQNDKTWSIVDIRRSSRQRDGKKRKAIQSGNTNDLNNYKRSRNKVNNMTNMQSKFSLPTRNRHCLV